MPPNTGTISSELTEKEPLLRDESSRKKRSRKCKIRMNGPDGVWSWFVAFANFLVNFIVVGLGRMSGILYVDFMNLFHIGRQTASVPFSVQQAARNLFGPLAGILGQQYGIRAVTIGGGIVGALSAASAYFVMDITWITIAWGLIFGISTALTTTLNQISIDQHFEKHRATAGGFAFSGGCVGAFVFPVVLDTLIEKYGMAGTFLVMGAIILNVVPAALLLKKPAWRKNEKNKTQYGGHKRGNQYGSLSSEDKSRETVTSNGNVISREKSTSDSTKNGFKLDFELLQDNSELVCKLLTLNVFEKGSKSFESYNDMMPSDKIRMMFELENIYSSALKKQLDSNFLTSEAIKDSVLEINIHGRKSISREISSDGHIKEAESQHVDTNIVQSNHHDYINFNEVPLRVYIRKKLSELADSRDAVFPHFKYKHRSLISKLLVELEKLHDMITKNENSQDIPTHLISYVPSSIEEEESQHHTEVSGESNSNTNTCCKHISTAVKLHTNPLFLLICLCRGVFMLTFIPIVTIIVDFAMDKGLEKWYGKYVIATLSVGDLLGRLCLGWITDHGCLSLPLYMLVVMIILGISTGTLPLMHSAETLIPAILLFGVLQGSLFVRHNILVTKYMESHEQSIGMGFINLLSGFLGFALPSYIGYFRDTLGSYDKMFYINGGICAFVGLIWAFEPLFVRYISSKRCSYTTL